MTIFRLSLILACSFCVAGCRDKTTTTLGSVDITFDGAPKTISVVDDTAHVELGEVKYDLKVANGSLTINGEDYGTVASGDKVKIRDGSVTINGKPIGPVTEAK
jgi:hypothetical protein